MTTSGSVDFSVTRANLIQLAYQHIGVLGEGESPSTNQTTEAALLLNMIVKHRETDGMPLWALKRGYCLPTADVSSQDMYSSGGNITDSYVSTTTSAAAISGASTIVVTSATGIAASYYIGILLDGGDMQWTTVNGALSGTTVTLTATLTGAVASGNRVYAYQTKSNEALKITDAWLLYTTGSTRVPMQIDSRSEYFSLGNLTSEGTPNRIYYDRQLTLGTLYFYPRFQGGDNVIEFSYHRPYEDFDATGDTPDFPQEYYLSIMLELAFFLGPKAGLDLNERKLLLAESKIYRDEALGFGGDGGSMYITPRQ